MSFLSLVFAAGAAAVAFPILFHLIRRTPRDQQEFSSLMFLEPTAPRLTKRSRLDDLLLLLLRGAAICLLALAFARPFFRSEGLLSLEDIRGRRVAIVLDTSASMQRGDIWADAINEVKSVLEDLDETDSVSLLTFDDKPRVLAEFDETGIESLRQQRAKILSIVSDLKPSWGRSELGTAIARALDELGSAEASERRPAGQIIVISDCQQGAETNSLQAIDWPAETTVEFRKMLGAEHRNASLRIVRAEDTAARDSVRVRVAYEAAGDSGRFDVGWADTSKPVRFVVPPGESRVLEIPRDQPTCEQLVMTGDTVKFDNSYFVAAAKPRLVTVEYYGSDASDDPEGLRYYLERVWLPTASRVVQFATPKATESEELFPPSSLTVVMQQLESGQLSDVVERVQAGGNALVVLNSIAMAEQLSALIGGVTASTNSQAQKQFRLLGQIDFRHPLFRDFAGPQFNDFTDIRFWSTVELNVAASEDINVIAEFDDNSPAIWERTLGHGRVTVMAAGWRPSASQLALSNKFLPLMSGILNQSLAKPLAAGGYEVGDLVPIEANGPTETIVTTPDGRKVALDRSTGQFSETLIPGVYVVTAGEDEDRFAVNVAPSESLLQPFDVADLGVLGVPIGRQLSAADELERQRMLKDQELEARQKIWKWLVVGTLALLIAEMAVSGTRLRSRPPTGAAV